MRHKKIKQEWIDFLFLIVIGIFLSAPAFLPGTLRGHDIEFHYGRIYGICDGLLSGDFFVKLCSNWFEGNGYLVGAFYGDFLLYIPAVLHLLGVKMQTSYQIFWVVINLLTLFIAYFSFKGIWKNERVAFLGAIVYSCNLYRLVDIYIRQAVGEYCAFLFFPLIALGFYKVFAEEENTDAKCNSGWMILSIAFSGLLNTHILSCEMVAIFGILLFVLLLRKFATARLWKYIGLTLTTTLGLSASFLVPFVDAMFIKGDTNVSDASRNIFSLAERGIQASFFRNLFAKQLGSIIGMEDGFAITFLWGLTIIAVSVLLSVFAGSFRKRKILFISGVFGLLALFMATKYFPWDAIRKLPGLENVVSSLQYPWRLLGLAGLFVALCFMGALVLPKNIGKMYRVANIAVMVLVIVITILPAAFFIKKTMERTSFIEFNDRASLKFMYKGGEEYLPRGTDVSLLSTELTVFGDAEISDYQKDGANVRFHIVSDSTCRIELPLLYYWYYKGTMNGVEIPVVAGTNNRVTVNLPENSAGDVEVFWDTPIMWRFSYVVTVATCLAVVVLICFKIYQNYFNKTIDNS